MNRKQIEKHYGHNFLTDARDLFQRQYAIREGESLEDGFWRATEPAVQNSLRGFIFERMMQRKFSPGGRILAGAGTNHRNTLNCFVLASDTGRFDSLDDVENLVLKVAATTKVGGGIGINFDPFAPAEFAKPVDIEIFHTLDPDHPDYVDFLEWQYTDITAYGQPKRKYDRRGANVVDYADRFDLDAPVIEVADDIASIFSAPFDAVRTGAKRVVLDWSNLRPSGAEIAGSGGTSSGAASFAIEVQHIIHWLSLGGHTAGPIAALRYVFQSVLRSVRQGGTRRGAGMATLSLSHPDRDIFLSCKDHEVEAVLGEISAFNISFLAEDKDMQDPFIEEVAAHAWQTGDPGLLFVDTINKDNIMLAELGRIVATNPCFTGDMRLLTEDGWVTFKEAAEHGKPLRIIQDSRITYEGGDDELPSNWKIDPDNTDAPVVTQASHAFLTKKNTEVIELTFSNGSVLRTTPDHLIATTIGMVEAGMLVEDHVILTVDEPAIGIYIPATTRVLSITAAGREDVYCIHENVRRSLIVEKVCARRCGEIPLAPGEPCDLGAINLSEYVHKGALDIKSLKADIPKFTNYLDDNLDYCNLPTDDAKRMSAKLRRTGLGVMGVAHMLIKLGLRYSSQQGRDKVRELMSLTTVEAVQWSEEAEPKNKRVNIGRRNVALVTIAPTGTTSMIMGASSGIEPIFSVTYTRKIGDKNKEFVDPILMDMLREHDPEPGYTMIENNRVEWDEDKVVKAIKANHGSVKGLSFVPKYMQDIFETSHEIHWRDHILMQAAAQEGMDYKQAGNSISKTINMPNSATVQDVIDAYRLAHAVGCKGITVYRDGSRWNQVLTTGSEISLECPTGVCEV